MAEPSGMSSSSARQAEPQDEMSFNSAGQAEPQEGMSSSSARQAEPQEGVSSSSALQAEPQEGMSSGCSWQAEPMEGISSCSAQETELRALQAAVRVKQDECEKLAARLWRCNFIYTPPEQDFDSRRVMGTICSLIDSCDPIHCTALEIAAGRRLYSVVVDSEPTSRLLLKHGNLQTRTTFIPLNNINGHVIDRKTVKVAQQIGGGPENVHLALDLVSYDIGFRPAMEWVFGSTLVCRDSETAKNVAFHPAVRCRVVTLDGDIFDPNGTMTGGAKLKGRSVLALLQDLKKMEEDTKTAEIELSLYTAGLQSMKDAGEKYTASKQKCNIMCHELNTVKEQVASRAHMQAEIESLRAQVAELAVTLDREKQTQQHAAARTRELEDKVRDNEEHKKRQIKQAEEEFKKAEKDAEVHASELMQREQEVKTLTLEVSELEKSVAAKKQQLADYAASSVLMHASLQRAEQEHIAAAEAVKEIKSRIESQKVKVAALDVELSLLVQKKEQLCKRNVEIELQIKKLNETIKALQDEATEWQNKKKSLEEENPWITSDRQYFGLTGGMYDFSQINEVGTQMAQLKEKKDKLAQGLITKAYTLLGKEEEQYQNVMREKQNEEAESAELVQYVKLDAEQRQKPKKRKKMKKM